MTNETTASQPKSIGDDAQFQLMMFGKVGLDPKGMTFKNIAAYIDNFRAPADQAAATIQAEGGVDWLGLALALEDRAKTVESQTTERSMAAAARGLRLMGAATIQEPVMVAEPDNRSLKQAPDLGQGDASTRLWLQAHGYGNVTPLHALIDLSSRIAKFTAAPMVADPAGVTADQAASVVLTDAQIDAIAEEQEEKYGQLCDADDMRIFARSVISEALKQSSGNSGKLPSAGMTLEAANLVAKAAQQSLAATVKAVPSEALELTELADAMQYWGGVFADGFSQAQERVEANGYSGERWIHARNALEWMRNRLYKHGKMGHPDAHAKYGSPFPGAAPLADKTGGGV